MKMQGYQICQRWGKGGMKSWRGSDRPLMLKKCEFQWAKYVCLRHCTFGTKFIHEAVFANSYNCSGKLLNWPFVKCYSMSSPDYYTLTIKSTFKLLSFSILFKYWLLVTLLSVVNVVYYTTSYVFKSALFILL